MPSFKLDFSNVEADSFTVVPPGTYDTIVKNVTFGKKETDDDEEETYPYLRFELGITGGDHDGRVLFYYASFAPEHMGSDGKMKRSSLPRTKAVLESFGVALTPLEIQVDPKTNQLTTPNLIGEPAKVRVRAGSWNGEATANVRSVQGLKKPGVGAPSATYK